jgi:C4-dicarboxylate-specific signal transduction histidine kinase
MTRLTARSSAIFIGTSEGTQVFRTVDEVPAQLRRRLEDSVQSVNSATILIADRRGREELMRALQKRMPQYSKQACMSQMFSASSPSSSPISVWLKIIVPIVLGASVWLLLGTKL